MGDTFMRRLLGAAMLDAATYEDVERDRGALPQAILVVLLSSVAAGIGAKGMSSGREAAAFMLSTGAIALMAWATWAFLMFQIGAYLLPQPDTKVDLGQMLRTLGFAATPGLIQVFALFPGARTPVFTLAAVWMLASSVVAVKQALDYSSLGRAVAVCTLGWMLSLAVAIVLGLVFSPALSGR